MVLQTNTMQITVYGIALQYVKKFEIIISWARQTETKASDKF